MKMHYRAVAAIWPSLAFVAARALAAGVPDSGQTSCYDGVSNLASCTDNTITSDSGLWPHQDGRFGRGAAFIRHLLTPVSSYVGAQERGLDYSKITGEGSAVGYREVLPRRGPKELACKRDNITGHTWEIKANDGFLHRQELDLHLVPLNTAS